MSDALILGLAVLAFAFVVFLVLAIKYPDIVREFFNRISELEITPTGIKVSRAVREAGRAVTQKERQRPDVKALRENLRRISPRANVLWVDDNPANNVHEVAALERLGVRVDQVENNIEAEGAARRVTYDLVISDIGRRDPESPQAGLELPNRLKSVEPKMPPIVYYIGHADSPRTPEGYPVTDVPSKLFDAIQSALSDSDEG